jgi:GxxExxY protein
VPISLRSPIRRLSQAEFGEVSFEVLRHVFAIHNQIGRFFDERIYKRELAFRMAGVRLEEPVDIVFDSFHKRYFLDVVAGDGGIFEFKSVESLAGRHRAQLLHYLLLCGVAHGKLVNIRPEEVEHEYVNTQWLHEDRTRFVVCMARWNALPGTRQLPDLLVPLLRDLGSGLEITLYEEAVTHFFGGPHQVETEVGVEIDGRHVGRQRFRLIAPDEALKITAFDGPLDGFESHARRLLQHSGLRAIAWVNITMKQVTFITLQR